MSVPVSPVPRFRPATPEKPGAATNNHLNAVRARDELVRMAYRNLAGATLVSAATAILFAVVIGIKTFGTSAWWWIAVMMGVAIFRLRLAAEFERKAPSEKILPSWEWSYVGATTLTALGWGISVWIFPTLNGGGVLGVIHLLVLAGVVTGSVRFLLPMRSASIAYLVAIMVPLAIRFFAFGSGVGVGVGSCVIIFVGYMAWGALQSHQALFDSLILRFDHDAIVAKLAEKNAQHKSREIEVSEAREKAESAGRAKGEFLATIGHEIRTPLNGVLGMLRAVRDTPLSYEQRDYLKIASDSAESLLLLINDLLDFSKIEAGRLEIERAPFLPATVARAVTDLMLARARDKGLQFDLELGDNLPTAVVGDATRLRQILVNLIGNAIKFTERGRIGFTVSCAERHAERVVLHFTVTDTGIGIDSVALDRIFQPFTQANNSMSRRYGGTGLGLAISMRLAQAMGGTLQVQSTLSHGTTFRLIVPCPLPVVATHPGVDEAPRLVVPQLRGRVLVVEDDAINQQVMDLFLKKLNLSATFAGDGETAVITATNNDFDLVLMDCQLPGIDGFEATRLIRAKLGDKRMPIVALTASASVNVREACRAAGMDDFLGKPASFEQLVALLQRHLPPP